MSKEQRLTSLETKENAKVDAKIINQKLLLKSSNNVAGICVEFCFKNYFWWLTAGNLHIYFNSRKPIYQYFNQHGFCYSN